LFLEGGVCLSHHFTTVCMGLNIITKKRENKCVAKRKKNCTNGVCEKNAIDWASNDIETQLQLKVIENNDSFQEWRTWVGVVMMV